MKLLTDENNAFVNWVWMYDVDRPFYRNQQKQRDKIAKPLYYASLAGLTESSYVNAWGGSYGNALQAASYGGHEAITKLLLEKGANANVQGGCYGNAIQAASYRSMQKE